MYTWSNDSLQILRSGGPGLQVAKDMDPPVWVDVPQVDNAFVINLGGKSLVTQNNTNSIEMQSVCITCVFKWCEI